MVHSLELGQKVKVNRAVTPQNANIALGFFPTQGIVEGIFDRFILLRMVNQEGKPLYREAFPMEEVKS